MSLLKPVQNQMAYLKAGIFGFQGSGKTFTASLIAIGLHGHIKSEKPVTFFDTETGSDFVLPKFKAAKVELLGVKSRAFKDVLDFLKEAEGASDIAIIDSITHVWREFVAAYKAKSRLKFLRIQDWGPIKEEWQRYTDAYVNTRLHIIMCGRAGNIFEDVKEDGNGSGGGKWKAVKVGTKMSAETETGYEPSLLLEMHKVQLGLEGGKYARRCSVIKDRFDAIDSGEFDDPTFENFLPHIELLNLGGEHLGVDTSRNSEELFDDDGEGERGRRARRRKIALEKIEAAMVDGFPSTKSVDKRAKKRIVDILFGTTSWTEVTGRPPESLEAGALILSALCREMAFVENLLLDEWSADTCSDQISQERAKWIVEVDEVEDAEVV